MKRSLFLILFAVLVMVMESFTYVSAQDVDNMSNEQLTELLLQIMQRLDQSGEAAEMPEPTPEPTSTATPVPTEIPEPELSDDRAELDALLTAIMQKLQQEDEQKPAPVSVPEEEANSIWEDKKLIIEALPGHMFIQPTQPVKPERDTPNNNSENHGKEDDSHGFVTDDDVEYCPPPYHWECYPDRCVCASPNG